MTTAPNTAPPSTATTTTTTKPNPAIVSPTVSTVTTRTINQDIWFDGFKVTVASVTYDASKHTLIVNSLWENLAVHTAKRLGAKFGVQFDDTDIPADATGKEYASRGVGATRDPYTIPRLSDSFDLDKAVLYFGALENHRATIELKSGFITTTEKPIDLNVATTLSLGFGATWKITSAEIVPWACEVDQPPYLRYKSAKKDEASIVLWADITTIDAPSGGLTFSTLTQGYTRIKLPDGTVLGETTRGVLMNKSQRLRNSPTCFSGIVLPAAGVYQLQISDNTEPTASLDITVK